MRWGEQRESERDREREVYTDTGPLRMETDTTQQPSLALGIPHQYPDPQGQLHIPTFFGGGRWERISASSCD